MTTTTTTRAAIATPVTRGSTRMLLWTAILAGPVFYASSAVQALAREGFDIRVHPLSQLATGETGWIQTLTFVVAGLGGIALAVAHRRLRSDGLGRRTAPLFIALFGLGFVVAGLFPMDPQNGFPAGAPAEAVPMSWHATVHIIAAAASFLALAVTCIILLVRSIRERRVAASVGHALVALVLLLPTSPEGSSIQIALTGLVAFGWLTVTALRLRASA